MGSRVPIATQTYNMAFFLKATYYVIFEIFPRFDFLFNSDYMDKMHRPGNKLMLVHCIELPELSIHNARMCCFH